MKDEGISFFPEMSIAILRDVIFYRVFLMRERERERERERKRDDKWRKKQSDQLKSKSYQGTRYD